MFFFFFFQAEDGIRDYKVTGVQTCALPICCVRRYADATGWDDESQRGRHWQLQLDGGWLENGVRDDQCGRRHADGDGRREPGTGVCGAVDRERYVADYRGERDVDHHRDGKR